MSLAFPGEPSSRPIPPSCEIVARVACPTYDGAREALERALALLPADPPLAARGEPLMLKPNLLAAHPPAAAVTTHPAVVDAALEP